MAPFDTEMRVGSEAVQPCCGTMKLPSVQAMCVLHDHPFPLGGVWRLLVMAHEDFVYFLEEKSLAQLEGSRCSKRIQTEIGWLSDLLIR